MKNQKNLKIFIFFIALITICLIIFSNQNKTYAYIGNDTVEFKIYHDLQTHQEEQIITLRKDDIIDLKQYVRYTDIYEVIEYSLPQPVIWSDYGDDIAYIKYKLKETEPEKPPIIANPIPDPNNPVVKEPIISKELKAYIYIEHKSDKGQNILATTTLQGNDGDTIDLRDYIQEKKGFEAISFEPESGILTFTIERRQDSAIIYRDKPIPAVITTDPIEPRGKFITNDENKEENKKEENKKEENKKEENKKEENKKNNQNNNREKMSKDKNIKLINGYPDGTMKPDKPVTRQEVAFIIYKLLYQDYKKSINTQNINIADVNKNSWSYEAISKLVSANIMENITQDQFKPKENATRAQVAMAIANIIPKTEEYIKTEIQFTDTQNHKAKEAIQVLVDRKIMNGYPDGTFKPDNSITRAELVVVLNKVLGKRKEDIQNETKFTDVKKSSWYYNDIQMAVQGE